MVKYVLCSFQTFPMKDITRKVTNLGLTRPILVTFLIMFSIGKIFTFGFEGTIIFVISCCWDFFYRVEPPKMRNDLPNYQYSIKTVSPALIVHSLVYSVSHE